MNIKFKVDHNLECKSLVEKISVKKNNGLYIYGKAVVGKTTFSQELVTVYETKDKI